MLGLKTTSRKVVFAFSGSAMMDGSKSELLNGNVRGEVQSKVLSSSSKTDSDTTPPLPLIPSGCEVNTQNQVIKVRAVVPPSDNNKSCALQVSNLTDQNSRALWPFNGPGSIEHRNVAIENHDAIEI